MANQTNSNIHVSSDLNVITQAYFELAKKYWTISLVCKLLVFLIGLTSVFFVVFTTFAPFIIVLLEISSEILLWLSDRTKNNIAEPLRRKLDARDSFGWSISKSELSDIMAKTSDNLYKLAPSETKGKEYFASKETDGARKALENIQESAWWSKHLSERMFVYCLVATICILVITFISLLLSIQITDNQEFIKNIGRTVTSGLMLLFTLGLLRMVIGYYEFSQSSLQIEKGIDHLLLSQKINDFDAIKIMHEYQFARASSPLLPTWVWKQMRGKLNKMWNSYRQQQVN
jgi:ABC-type multidrug transport system fused ATPase/permease subunit